MKSEDNWKDNPQYWVQYCGLSVIMMKLIWKSLHNYE